MAQGLLRRLTASAVMTGSLLVVAASSAGAQGGAITAYDGYPPALPAGCPDGPDALLDVSWRNGTGQRATSLDAFVLSSAETFTVSWSAFAAGCLAPDGSPAIAVSTKVYDAVVYPFDRDVDQRLLGGWERCGAGVGPCRTSEGRYELAVTLPSNEVTCVVQFGLVIGPPLAVVGPNGSYYNAATRGDAGPDMLVAARNGEIAGCVAPAEVTPPTGAPTASTQPTPPSVPIGTDRPSSPDNAALNDSVIVAAPAGPLPFTGGSPTQLVAAGLAVAAGGALLVLWGVLLSARRAAQLPSRVLPASRDRLTRRSMNIG